MLKVCRVCLDVDVPLVDIFAEICDPKLDLSENSPAYVISQFQPNHSVVRGDSMPQFICLSCIHGVQAAYRCKVKLDQGPENYRKLCLKQAKQKSCDEEEESHEIKAEPENAMLPEKTEDLVEDFADAQPRVQMSFSMDNHEIRPMVQIPGLSQVTEAEVHICNNLQGNKANKTQSRHCGKLPFVCDVCGKGFMTEYHLKRHEPTHRHKRTSKLNRKHLGSKNTYRSPALVKKKPESEESDLQMLSCHDTSSRSRSPSLLKIMKCTQDPGDTDISSHTKKSCSTKSSPRKLNLTCQECGKTFAFKQDLVRHILVHNDESPFKCTYCKKQFARRDHLANHTRIHTGERPFGCFQCGKHFTERSSLRRHVRSRHVTSPPAKGNSVRVRILRNICVGTA
ncbi:zinc finger protein 544-like [Drosophila miranda]|uniref:zinc finger protein 544-like n=1 Tax=Drosophila miranda TaxID=7229 RepID=UPI0007E6DDAF|nr:zinc finger protein 544-like [Drosophila miranda]